MITRADAGMMVCADMVSVEQVPGSPPTDSAGDDSAGAGLARQTGRAAVAVMEKLASIKKKDKGGRKKVVKDSSPPKRLTFVGPEGFAREKHIVDYSLERRESAFTKGGVGKFWEETAEIWENHPLWRKEGAAKVSGKTLKNKMDDLVKEAEKLYDDEQLVSGAGSSGVDNERERLLVELIQAKREVEGYKSAVARRTEQDRTDSQALLDEAIEVQASKAKDKR